MATPPRPPFALLLTTLGTAILLAGCGGNDAKSPATQVAAKVNGAEISVHQINTLLGKTSGLTAENTPKARQEVLERLVTQQLAVEQALAKKLDRNPDVLLSLEAARKEILARAYVDQIAAANPKPGDDEIRRYYDEHPDLFAKRRVYALQELTVPRNGANLDELKALVSGGKSMEDIGAWLKAHNVPARASQGNRAAEQLPLELLPRIAQMKDRQTALIESPQALLVMHLAASQPAPVDEATARPKIAQFLHNERSGKAVAEDMKRLKGAAKIEYVGDFAKLADAAPTTAPAATAPATAALPAPASAASTLEKGIAGLK